MKKVVYALLGIAMLYLLLLIPERKWTESADKAPADGKGAFAWNQDAYWEALEARYREIRNAGCSNADALIRSVLLKAEKTLQRIEKTRLSPDAQEFIELEQALFQTGPLVGGCALRFPEYADYSSRVRNAVKRQSEHWNMSDDTVRTTLYRLLYGSRAAVEEVMLQLPAGSVKPLQVGTEEPSQTPFVSVRGVRIHSGDILVSRGGAPTSALIARGNDYPGNFSHIAFVYVDPAGKEAKIVESHIEVGVVVSSAEQYLADKKLRVMVLRPRADLPQIVKDPMLPHKAAEYAYRRATTGHIPYDFPMDYKDHAKLFCSEVASEGYERFGVRLWAGVSHISSPGLRRWLAAFGVRNFETQEPSDLEYDPQLRVVAEWRDPETLRKDRLDNAATEVMLEGAEKGDDITYKWYLLPPARIVKAYSAILNRFGKAGPIPEGMTAATSLRTLDYMEKHDAIAGLLDERAKTYRKEKGYEPPYWQLVKLARAAKEDAQRRQ